MKNQLSYSDLSRLLKSFRGYINVWVAVQNLLVQEICKVLQPKLCSKIPQIVVYALGLFPLTFT